MKIVEIVIFSILGWVMFLATMKIVSSLFFQAAVEVLRPFFLEVIKEHLRQKKAMLENMGVDTKTYH